MAVGSLLRCRSFAAIALIVATLFALPATAGASSTLPAPQPKSAATHSTPAPASPKGTDAAHRRPPVQIIPAPGGGTSFWDDFSSFALTWLPIIFMGLIVILIGLTVRYIPRTKPQEIKPDTSQSTRGE